jgi:ankyrin repeat protein
MHQSMLIISTLFPSHHEQNILNIKNLRGQTPLYVATQNGNNKIISLLLDKGANPFLLSNADEKNLETLLEVCCRWNHNSTLELLLNQVQWNTSHIAKAIKKCKTKEMKSIFAKYKGSKKSL